MMNELEKVKVAIGNPLIRKLGDQEFEFYPLGVDSIPDLFELIGKTGSNPQKVIERENSTLLVKLIDDLLKESFPDLDDKMRKRLGMKYFTELQDILTELHLPTGKSKEELQKRKEQFYKDNPHLKST